MDGCTCELEALPGSYWLLLALHGLGKDPPEPPEEPLGAFWSPQELLGDPREPSDSLEAPNGLQEASG